MILSEKESYAIMGACFEVYKEKGCGCCEKVILEIKAVSKLTDEHRAQVFNYLHATGYQPGRLVNFGHFPKVEYERIANSRGKGASSS